MTGPLVNARHERFAQEVAKGLSADAAYVAAGYTENRKNAHRLRTNEGVSRRIEDILSQAAQEAVITVQDIARQLDEDRKFAREMESPAAAVAATMGKAKVLGLIIDKAQIDASMTVNVLPEDAAL